MRCRNRQCRTVCSVNGGSVYCAARCATVPLIAVDRMSGCHACGHGQGTAVAVVGFKSLRLRRDCRRRCRPVGVERGVRLFVPVRHTTAVGIVILCSAAVHAVKVTAKGVARPRRHRGARHCQAAGCNDRARAARAVLLVEGDGEGEGGPLCVKRNISRKCSGSNRCNGRTGTVLIGKPTIKSIIGLRRTFECCSSTVGMLGWITACMCSRESGIPLIFVSDIVLICSPVRGITFISGRTLCDTDARLLHTAIGTCPARERIAGSRRIGKRKGVRCDVIRRGITRGQRSAVQCVRNSISCHICGNCAETFLRIRNRFFSNTINCVFGIRGSAHERPTGFSAVALIQFRKAVNLSAVSILRSAGIPAGCRGRSGHINRLHAGSRRNTDRTFWSRVKRVIGVFKVNFRHVAAGRVGEGQNEVAAAGDRGFTNINEV